LHTHSAKPESAPCRGGGIHVYFNFTPDQASKVNLLIIHECAL